MSRNDRNNHGGRQSGRGGSNNQDSRNSYQGGRDSRDSNQGGRRSFGGGGRGRGGGGRNKSFDPTHVIMKSQTAVQEVVEEVVYENTHQFNDFQIVDTLKDNIEARGYKTPTPIQDQIIPHILDGRDVVGIANTGTGKTAAFLIPLLNKVLLDPQEKVLIITPTRELALQIRDELRLFTENMRIYSTLCIGGASIHRQIDHLRRGQSFVIGTPGRIKDLNQRGRLNFNQFSNIVLDEVDRMLDMGFVHEIKEIINSLPKDRSSLFFSATMTNNVKDVMRDFLNDPIFISVKTQETSHNVHQDIVRTQGRAKVDVLHDLLVQESFQKVLVFGRTKHAADRLTRTLQERGIKANAIHGNKSQGQRERALKQFKNNHVQVLIATDVVARGVDIKNVTHVINFELPESHEVYVHRIGRTGRAGSKGIALTFVD
jgi:ATP-dependent RNA helicase RhlE